jgi:hypothetical protein
MVIGYGWGEEGGWFLPVRHISPLSLWFSTPHRGPPEPDTSGSRAKVKSIFSKYYSEISSVTFVLLKKLGINRQEEELLLFFFKCFNISHVHGKVLLFLFRLHNAYVQLF